MIKVLVFSKNRPMQLEAYLDSLFTLTGVSTYADNVAIILNNKEDYAELIDSYSSITSLQWIDDKGNFDYALRNYAESITEHDTVLFGCDDVVFIRPVGIHIIENILGEMTDTLGFSLRLGKNIANCPKQEGDARVFYPWNWINKPSHWGYPFELMASCYRGSLVKEIIESNKSQMQCPNHLESYGVTYCINNKREQQPIMAMFNTLNYAVAQDVNRVQHHFQNKYDGTEEHDPEYLKTLFKDGKRLDWTNLFGIVSSDCFVGHSYWKVK